MASDILSWLPIAVSVLFIIGFGVLYANFRIVLYIVNSLMWVVYAVYETMIFSGALCYNGCGARVDLLAIYPILLVSTLGGVTVLVHSLQQHHKK